MTIEELREKNPGHWVIPSDEEYANVVAAEEAVKAAEAERVAELERERQSINDQIANLQTRLNELQGQVESTEAQG